ncbi:peptidase U32 family protein [Savagea faecisuis]|uniref:U32 family peptidase n=1 Tax=Savagea faecisuis TaxID=1274803 RepID=A0ABW3H1J2_9BACL
MTKRVITKKPEVLSPAGTLEKLKMAIIYGADAVFIGGEAYGLRSRAGNFSYDEMREARAFADEYGAKIYVTANIVAHEGDTEGADEFFQTLKEIGIDAVIVSDPALIEICATAAPGLPIHLSTQASATNYETLNFWKDEGLERIVLAREVGMDEINEMQKHTDVEIEVFIHGAMCISYSGRCVLSNYMSDRDANRGGCSQSCRWKYDIFEMPEPGEKNSHLAGLSEEELEAFSMSSVDMAMIRHIPEIVESGVESLKIEGRMKSIHYVSTVSNVYRAAIDAYCADPDNYVFNQAWEDELWKVAQRELASGFYWGTPTENEQLFGKPRRIPRYQFVGQVLDYDEETQIATIQQRNNFGVGDDIEFYGPGFRHSYETVEQLWDEDGEEIDRARNAMMICKMKVNTPVQKYDMIRKQR